jgi:GxxExxY protein
MTTSDYNRIGALILSSAMEVHKELGPGLLESVYEDCLLYELQQRNLNCQNQVQIPVIYKGMFMNSTFRADIIVESAIIIEIKCSEILLPVYKAQLISYLKLADKRLGYLINFKSALLKEGFHRFANQL